MDDNNEPTKNGANNADDLGRTAFSHPGNVARCVVPIWIAWQTDDVVDRNLRDNHSSILSLVLTIFSSFLSLVVTYRNLTVSIFSSFYKFFLLVYIFYPSFST